jgi:hypothetical protein
MLNLLYQYINLDTMPRFGPIIRAIYYPIKGNGKRGKGALMKEVTMYCDHEDQSKNIDESIDTIKYIFIKTGKKEYKFYFLLDISDEQIAYECKNIMSVSLRTPHLYTALKSDSKTE